MPDGNLMAFVRDNTVRNAANKASRAADARLRFALHNAHVGIWDMDYASGVLDWSEEMDAHYGIAPGSFARTFEAFVDYIHPDDRDAVLAEFGRAIASGSEFSVVHRVNGEDGKLRWLGAPAGS